MGVHVSRSKVNSCRGSANKQGMAASRTLDSSSEQKSGFLS